MGHVQSSCFSRMPSNPQYHRNVSPAPFSRRRHLSDGSSGVSPHRYQNLGKRYDGSWYSNQQDGDSGSFESSPPFTRNSRSWRKASQHFRHSSSNSSGGRNGDSLTNVSDSLCKSNFYASHSSVSSIVIEFDWIFDCGASHFCNDKKLFSKFKMLNDELSVARES